MLFGRWPHDLDFLPNSERTFLDRWYDRYIEIMYGAKKPLDDDELRDAETM